MLIKTGLNNVLLLTLFNFVNMLFEIVTLDSGSAISINIFDTYEQCEQRKIRCTSGLKYFVMYIADAICLFSSVCVCRFASKGSEETYVLVGTATDMILNPRSFSGGSIHTFRLVTMPDDSGQKLELVHTVSVEAVLKYCLSVGRLPQSQIGRGFIGYPKGRSTREHWGPNPVLSRHFDL